MFSCKLRFILIIWRATRKRENTLFFCVCPKGNGQDRFRSCERPQLVSPFTKLAIRNAQHGAFAFLQNLDWQTFAGIVILDVDHSTRLERGDLSLLFSYKNVRFYYPIYNPEYLVHIAILAEKSANGCPVFGVFALNVQAESVWHWLYNYPFVVRGPLK